MSVAPVSTRVPRRHHRKSLPDAVALAAPGLCFNARGIVAAPCFVLHRPPDSRDKLAVSVRGHCIGKGKWIAEACWHSHCGDLPGDGCYPHERSTPHPSRSEAVEAALDRALRQMAAQLGPRGTSALDRARTWAAEALREVRAADESLPLRGVTVADLFAGGLGGFGLALAGLGARVVLACEIDAQARAVYAANIRPEELCSDVRGLDPAKVKADIITCGLLCQAFSKSGKRQGFEDPALRDAYAATLRLLAQADAKAVIVECAREFLTHGGGANAEELRNVLRLAGYRVQHRTLNAADYGLPQVRARSFIVATRCGLQLPDALGYLFPEAQERGSTVADILDANAPTIGQAELVPHLPEPEARATRPVEVARIAGKSSQGYRVYSVNAPGVAVTASSGGRAPMTGAYAVAGGARPLSAREACRMQGMPEWARHHATPTHAKRHAGNAVAVPVARAVARGLALVLSTP